MQPTAPDAPRLFGRRKGRPLRVRKSTLFQNLLPQFEITLPESSTVDPHSWFVDTTMTASSPSPSLGDTKAQRSWGRGGQELLPTAAPPPLIPPREGEGKTVQKREDSTTNPYKELWLEIGFGGGEHLAAQAAQHPEIAMIGCEPFQNGIASMLDHIERQKLHNIRIYPGDARLLLTALPPASLQRAFVLFADPWPKKRHADRRFIQQVSLQQLARALKPGGQLTLATDDPTLQAWTTEQITQSPDFIPVEGISPQRPADWVITRYEEKALQACRTPLYYTFSRVTEMTQAQS